MDVVAWRNEGVEVTGGEHPALDQLQTIVKLRIDLLVLATDVEANQAPGEVVVHRRLGAGRHHKREERERAVARTEEEPLPDASPHSALRGAPPVFLRKPGRIGQQLGKARPDGITRSLRRCGCADRRPHGVDERPHNRDVDYVLVAAQETSVAAVRHGFNARQAGALPADEAGLRPLDAHESTAH